MQFVFIAILLFWETIFIAVWKELFRLQKKLFNKLGFKILYLEHSH